MNTKALLKLASHYNKIISQAQASVAPYTKCDPKLQLALNKLLGLNLRADGLCGAQTASALEIYRGKFNDTRNWNDASLWQDIIAKGNPSKVEVDPYEPEMFPRGFSGKEY